MLPCSLSSTSRSEMQKCSGDDEGVWACYAPCRSSVPSCRCMLRGKRRKRSSDDDEEDDEEDDDDDEYRAPKKAAKAAGAKRKSGGGGGGGFTALKKLSPELSALVGESEMSRPQLTKFFTGYFKVRAGGAGVGDGGAGRGRWWGGRAGRCR